MQQRFSFLSSSSSLLDHHQQQRQTHTSKHLRVLLVVLVLLAASALQAADAAKPRDRSKSGRWRRPPPPPPSPGAQLFTQEADILTWDSDELNRIHNLHVREFKEVEKYLQAPNLAEYLGLHPVEALHMSVPLNVIFVGFKGEGNAKVQTSDEELMEWFKHIDHVLPHKRVALSELTCAEDGHCSGDANITLPPSTLPSFVHLNFTCNVVSIQQGAVLDVFERAIMAFSRPTDPEHETGDQQVDALKMEEFIDSFINALGLERSYSMLVINPKWSPSLPSYSYRIGFSEPELRLLHEQVNLPELQPGGAKHLGAEPEPPQYGTGGYNAWPFSINKFKVQDLQAQSSAWAFAAGNYLTQLEDYHRHVTKLIGPRTKGTAAVTRAATIMANGETELKHLLTATLRLLPEHLHNPRWRATHPLEDCPTPLWVSHSRWLLLDLTARRTDWGPALGGDGVVHYNSLPDVNYAFGTAESKRAEKRAAKSMEPDQAQLKESLTVMRSQRLAAVSNMQQHAKTMVGHVVGGAAPGVVDASLAANPDGSPVAVNPDGQPIAPPADPQMDKQQAEVLLQAELNVYEQFAVQHCKGRVDPPAVCHEIEEAVLDLRHQLQVAAKSSGNKIVLHREHNWDIFGILLEDHEVTAAYSAAKDVFFSEINQVLSRAVRHVIAPPSASWHHMGYLHDTASPYAHRVHFTIYTIKDTSRQLGPWRDRGIDFDLESFKLQLQRLAMPHQAFSFSQLSLNLLDDPILAAAFSVSLRTSFNQVPHAVSDPVENEIVFLDSQELALRLRRRFETGAVKRAGQEDPHAVLEVPVFIFELDRDEPVLIDQHYNARALEDLVIVVQNAANQDEHPTGMMCDGILLQRPLSPLKHALLAVLQHLGGILPPHLGYSPSRKLVEHDWLWSVGGHPLSWTSWGGRYSQMHIDALHRTYILDVIDSSVDMINDGIIMLQEARPNPKLFPKLQRLKSDMQQLLQMFAQAVSTWRSMAANGASLDYPSAAEMILSSEAMSKQFLQQARKVMHELQPHHCAARSKGLPWLLVLMIYSTSVSAGLAVALLLLYPLFKKKAKAL